MCLLPYLIPFSAAFPQMTELELASCKLRRFPEFLKNQSNLVSLDLSDNELQGEIPHWIWELTSLRHLNLSCNSLTGFEDSPQNLAFHVNWRIYPPYVFLFFDRTNFTARSDVQRAMTPGLACKLSIYLKTDSVVIYQNLNNLHLHWFLVQWLWWPNTCRNRRTRGALSSKLVTQFFLR